MDLKEVREKSRKMIATFVNEVGLDGEWYSQLNTTPLVFGTPKLDNYGEYVSPETERLEDILEERTFDEKSEKILRNKGMILINKSYRQGEDTPQLYVTLIHEIFHANRDLLVYDNFRNGKNEAAYSYNNGKFEQNTGELSTRHADASQEILKGNIDNSQTTIDSYSSKTSKEIEDLDWREGKIEEQMTNQQMVDESLVDIMAILSYKLYNAKQNGITPDIWDMIQKIRNKSKEEYDELKKLDEEYLDNDTMLAKGKCVMCDILLRHHDFELFNWMLDPITYSQGDIHYDFFGQYAKNDTDLLEKLYEGFEAIDLDDNIPNNGGAISPDRDDER